MHAVGGVEQSGCAAVLGDGGAGGEASIAAGLEHRAQQFPGLGVRRADDQGIAGIKVVNRQGGQGIVLPGDRGQHGVGQSVPVVQSGHIRAAAQSIPDGALLHHLGGSGVFSGLAGHQPSAGQGQDAG